MIIKKNLTSVFHLKEALGTFSKMSLAESPVSRQMESEVGAKRLLNSRLNKASILVSHGQTAFFSFICDNL